LPLVKHFFFPGFTPRTGGLLRENSLLRRRDEFQADPGAQAAFWTSVAGRAPPEGALKVSLFSYAGAPIEALARAIQRHAGPVWLAATDGTPTAGLPKDAVSIPFLSQDRYDELLWACDLNFVRGEDSFVRAQWAGRPFAWNIYPTDDGAHWVKMSAFLARYTAGLDRTQAGAITSLWEAWNRRGEEPGDAEARPNLAESWAAFVSRREVFEAHAREWARRLAMRPDLADALVDFVDKVL
jgi:uncharacterized repeat protein (TIGR03837 family)